MGSRDHIFDPVQTPRAQDAAQLRSVWGAVDNELLVIGRGGRGASKASAEAPPRAWRTSQTFASASCDAALEGALGRVDGVFNASSPARGSRRQLAHWGRQ